MDPARRLAMGVLGNGLYDANHFEDALSVQEAELAMKRRLGASEHSILVVQSNLASTYRALGRFEEALSMRRDLYSVSLRRYGEEHEETLIDAYNYAIDLLRLKRFEEVKQLLRKNMPVVRRVVGENAETTLRMKMLHAEALYMDFAATLDDLREAVTTLEETERTARRVLGGAHPTTGGIKLRLRDARAALAARETPRA